MKDYLPEQPYNTHDIESALAELLDLAGVKRPVPTTETNVCDFLAYPDSPDWHIIIDMMGYIPAGAFNANGPIRKQDTRAS